MRRITALIPETSTERANHDPCHDFVNMDGSLTPDGELLVHLAFEVMKRACYQNAASHGWWDSDRSFGEIIALAHSELSEALEEFRNGHAPQELSYQNPQDRDIRVNQFHYMGEVCKPEGIPAEIADVFIRLLDYSGRQDVPIGQAFIEKHAFNFTRPHRHGGKVL